MSIEQQYDRGNLAKDYAIKSEKFKDQDLGRQFLREQVGVLPRDARVADIGCGSGLDLKAYREMGFTHLIGVDPSEKFLDEARTLLGDTVEFKRGSFEKLPLPDETTDAVVSRHALHYSTDLKEALLEVARILKPGGKLMVVMSHPALDEQLPRDEHGNVIVTLFDGTVSITFPQHRLDELFSPEFFNKFRLETRYEYEGPERDGSGSGQPNSLCFVATRL